MKIIHLFQWKLTDIISYIPQIKEQGFDAIQLSPMQGTKDNGDAYWLLYQPINLKIGNYQIGTKEELINVCKVAKECDIKVIVDVVLRHCAGDEWEHLKPHKNVDPELLPYLAEPINCEDYNNRWQCTHRCTGMPMFDYENKDFILKALSFLDELLDCGVWGFRLDQLKHYMLPNEGGTLIETLSKYNIYGECIYCEQQLLDEYSKYMSVLTEGRPSNLSKLVAKFSTHDDYHEFGITKHMDADMQLREWNVLVNDCGFDALWFAVPLGDPTCNLWMCEKMKEINRRNVNGNLERYSRV